MYMMTPRDQISQDLSYFSGPSTSGAEMIKVRTCHPRTQNIILTNIVGSVAGGLQRVAGVGLLGESEVSQL